MLRDLFRRGPATPEPERDARLPPGQYPTEKWPVLHAGGIPKVDPHIATWDFTVDGLVESPLRLSYADVLRLPRKTVHADVHCVTRWSLFDSDWEGIPVAEVMKLVRLGPGATHVMVHAEGGFTANLSLDDFLRDENMLVVGTVGTGSRLPTPRSEPDVGD